MKNLSKLAIVLITIVAVNACGPNKNSPEYVAKTFIKHLNMREFDEAKKLGTENTAMFLEQLKQDTTKIAKDVKIEDMKCVVTGETAVCNCKVDNEDDSISLVKVDDKWLVDMKKEQSMSNLVDSLMGNMVEGSDTLK